MEDVYLDGKVPTPATAKHRAQFGMVEDAFNVRWKELVSYSLHITFDESRVVGWYKSSITIGPEPKPILTNATLHSMWGFMEGAKGERNVCLCHVTYHKNTITVLDNCLSKIMIGNWYLTLSLHIHTCTCLSLRLTIRVTIWLPQQRTRVASTDAPEKDPGGTSGTSYGTGPRR